MNIMLSTDHVVGRNNFGCVEDVENTSDAVQWLEMQFDLRFCHISSRGNNVLITCNASNKTGCAFTNSENESKEIANSLTKTKNAMLRQTF